MSNSSLVCYTKLSPNYNSRNASISKITVHHMAGNLSVETCGNVFASSSRQASSNYGIGSDGRIGMYVQECNRSWASSSPWNDHRAVTIEVANSSTGGDWPVSDAAWNSLVNLCVDICQRNGIDTLSWTGGTDGSLTCHYMYASTSCPGPYLKARMSQLAHEVNTRLWNGHTPTAPSTSGSTSSNRKPFETHIHYALRTYAGDWLAEVTDFGEGSEGFAGIPGGSHDLLYMYVDEGSIKYRVHIIGGGWLDWVTKADKNDTVYGCAGIPGRVIDGVQAYYYTPDGKEYKQVWYRSQTTRRTGYLPVCCDDGTSSHGYDGWAGIYNEPLDRLQMAICDYNPF